MTYQTGGLINDADYNSLAATLNTNWSTGSGNSGYGQTALTDVAEGTTVAFTPWLNLVNRINTIANHQNSSVTAMPAPATGGSINYLSAINTNLTTINTNRLNCAAQATYVNYASTTSVGQTWTDKITYTQTVTFSSANAARYFFNAGGQIALAFYQPTGSAIDNLFNALATACGTVVLSSPVSGTMSVGATAFNGVTKVGGSGTTDTLATNTGFYALTTTDQLIFRQYSSAGTPAGYTTSFISVNARVDATGSVLTFTTVFDENWSAGTGLVVAAGTQTTLTVRPPRSTTDSPAGYLVNTWGTPSVNSSYVRL